MMQRSTIVLTLAAFPLGWIGGILFLGESRLTSDPPLELEPETPYSVLSLTSNGELDRLLTCPEADRDLLAELEFLAGLSDDALAGAYERARLEGAYGLMRAIEGYWALRDPRGALAYAKWHIDECEDLAAKALAHLAEEEGPESSVRAALDLGHKGLLTDKNMSIWKEDRVSERLDSYRAELEEQSLIARTFAELVESDPQGAAEQALELEDRRARREAVRGVARAWAEAEPQAALTWAKEVRPDALRQESTRLVLSRWANNDPAQCAEHVSGLPKSLSSIPVIEELVEAWGASAPEDALAWIGDEVSGLALDKAMDAWVNSVSQPEELADLLLSQNDLIERRPEALEGLVARWGEEDPARAMDWAMAQEGAFSEHGVRAALRGWAEQSPAEALEYMEGLQEEGMVDDAEGMITAVAAGMSSADPEMALTVLESGAFDLEDRETIGIIADSLSNWADTSPNEAAEWMEGRLDSLVDSGSGWWMIRGLVTTWVESDPQGVESWVAELPESRATDSAIQSLAHNLMATDREAAFRWASRASDANFRMNILTNMLADLPRHSGVAEVLAQAPFADEDRPTIDKIIHKSGHGAMSPWEGR